MGEAQTAGRRSRPAPGQLTIAALESESGVITLSDGSRWQVGPGDAGTVAPWAPGRPAALSPPAPLRELLYLADGSRALVCPAS